MGLACRGNLLSCSRQIKPTLVGPQPGQLLESHGERDCQFPCLQDGENLGAQPPARCTAGCSGPAESGFKEGVNLAMPPGQEPWALVCGNVYVPGTIRLIVLGAS